MRMRGDRMNERETDEDKMMMVVASAVAWCATVWKVEVPASRLQWMR